MLGDCFGAFKLLPALLATILVGRHGLESSNGGGGVCGILRLMADVEKPHPKATQRFLAVGKRSFASQGYRDVTSRGRPY
jgi:hypothetical protein